jgi:hypothetical protein
MVRSAWQVHSGPATGAVAAAAVAFADRFRVTARLRGGFGRFPKPIAFAKADRLAE